MSVEEPGLVRYWFEFDLSGHAPERGTGVVHVDGGTVAYRLLGRGAGVTGYDEADCLNLLREVLGDDPPTLVHAERNPVIDDRLAMEVGNVAWRGVWFPRFNQGGPTIG